MKMYQEDSQPKRENKCNLPNFFVYEEDIFDKINLFCLMNCTFFSEFFLNSNLCAICCGMLLTYYLNMRSWYQKFSLKYAEKSKYYSNFFSLN